MNANFCFVVMVTALAFPLSGWAGSAPGETISNTPDFKNLADLKWDKILPDLGENSPEICFLRVDPTTHATSLLIRTPKAIHVRKHWHRANETHTIINGIATFACDSKRVELGPGGSTSCLQK